RQPHAILFPQTQRRIQQTISARPAEVRVQTERQVDGHGQAEEIRREIIDRFMADCNWVYGFNHKKHREEHKRRKNSLGLRVSVFYSLCDFCFLLCDFVVRQLPADPYMQSQLALGEKKGDRQDESRSVNPK